MKLDLPKGWSSAYTLESVIMQIASSIGGAAIKKVAYMDEPQRARQEYAEAMRGMGWGVPTKSAD